MSAICTEMLKEIERLKKENEELKERNLKLIESIPDKRDWRTIREGILAPMIARRFGDNSCLDTNLIDICNRAVKELLNLKSVYAINEYNGNYDEALSIAKDVMEALCKHEWRNLQEMCKYWSEHQQREDFYKTLKDV